MVDDENIRLSAENKILEQERDILKKAAAPQGHLSLRSGIILKFFIIERECIQTIITCHR